MWDIPEPGIEPVSPALAGGFLTTVPPGKYQENFDKCKYFERKPVTWQINKVKQKMPVSTFTDGALEIWTNTPT